MEGQLQDQFIRRLEEKYGSWDRTTSRFGSASFGSIAKDLCISASQFSKLLYGSATEGMYTIDSENLGIGGGYPYSKGFRLVRQNYSDNLLCHCE